MEMDTFRPPGSMDFSCGNVPVAWKKWLQSFSNFMIASERHKKPDAVKLAVLLNCIGDEGVAIYNTFTREGENYSGVLEEFETNS